MLCVCPRCGQQLVVVDQSGGIGGKPTSLSDAQTVALVAAHSIDQNPREATSWAIQVVAESIMQINAGELHRVVSGKQKGDS